MDAWPASTLEGPFSSDSMLVHGLSGVPVVSVKES